MLNLRKRIKELQDNTSSLEAKAACKEVLESFINLPENQISSAIVEKLKTVEDSDKHVTKFIHVTEKINAVNDLGVARAIATLKESEIYSYPGLKYGLTKIENGLVYKQVKVVESSTAQQKDFKPGDTWSSMNMKSGSFKIEESNVQGQPEYMLVDATLECLKTFVWDKVVEGVYNSLKTTREELSEAIDLAIGLNSLKGGKSSFFFDSIVPKLEEHFVNPTDASRTSIIEDLKKLNYYPVARTLSESLNKIKRASGGVHITADNGKCAISSIYSPILLENGSEYFFIKGNFYSKKDSVISKLNEEAKALPEKFKQVCRIISSPNVFLKEGKISFFLKRDKVEILENESKVEVRFNGSKVTSNELAKNMVSAGLFRLDESQIAYDVQMMVEQFENIFDLDFGKIIESTVYPGSYAILLKDGDKIYLNKVNESQKSNEFFSGLNATQARNQVLEFIGFDIKESMSEYLDKDDVKLNELKESQSEIIKSIAVVEASLTKINDSMKNEFMASSPELVELKSNLENEVIKLKNTHRSLSDEIKAFETKSSSDAGYEVGEEVKINETGESATVSSISNDNLIVITSSGKTVEVPVNKVTSMDAVIAQANDKNAAEDDVKESEESEKQECCEECDCEVCECEVKETADLEDVSKKKLTAEAESDKVIESESGVEDATLTDTSTDGFVKATISADQGGEHAGEVVEILADDYAAKGDEELVEVKIGDDVVFVEKKYIKVSSEAMEPAEPAIELPTVADTVQTVTPASTSVSGVANVKEDDDDEEEETISIDDLDDDKSEEDEEEGESEVTIDDIELPDTEKEEEEEETISIDDLGDTEKEEGEEEVLIDAPATKEPGEEVAPEPVVITPALPTEPELLRAKLQKSLTDLEDIRSEMKTTFTSTDTITVTINAVKGMLDALQKDQMAMKNDVN